MWSALMHALKEEDNEAMDRWLVPSVYFLNSYMFFEYSERLSVVPVE